jgi:hypothetical protein
VKAKPVGVDGDTAGTYFCDKYNILALKKTTFFNNNQ